jgi:hypothetical protein
VHGVTSTLDDWRYAIALGWQSSGIVLNVGSISVHPLWLQPPHMSLVFIIALSQGSWNRIMLKSLWWVAVMWRAVWHILLDHAVFRLYMLMDGV